MELMERGPKSQLSQLKYNPYSPKIQSTGIEWKDKQKKPL